MFELSTVFDCPSPVALITGSGAPRVGRTIAEHFASLGCRIALHANRSVDEANQVASKLHRDHGSEVLVTHGSLQDESVPARIVAESQQRFGRLDILVNSAAIWSPTPLADVTASEMRRYFEINTIGSFLAARAAADIMAAQPAGGSIINLGDWATVRPYLQHSAYFPSKGAVEVMTRSLAVEFAQLNRKIRVNCIQPGPVLLADDVDEDKRVRLAQSTLVGELGSAEAVAHAAQFLCENPFVTGICLPVDGGRQVFSPDGLQAGLNTG
ncbi:MAG: SDR family oxidoreductase [Planctomycetota bacterium]